jgi:hypothetical protein
MQKGVQDGTPLRDVKVFVAVLGNEGPSGLSSAVLS